MTKRNYSKAQEQYMMAKVVIDELREQVRHEIKVQSEALNLDPFNSEEDLEKMVDLEMDIEEKYNYWEAREVYNQAVDELLKWAKKELTKKVSHYPRFQEAVAVFDKVKRFPHMIDKVLDLAMAYSPELDPK